MRTLKLSLPAVAALVLLMAPGASQAQTALSGVVSSAEEGPMEGVLVTAKKDGSTIAITVVSDAQGHYSFPAGKLDPGHYALRIRAIGYDLDGKTTADVAAGNAATADLKLKKTHNVASQLTNAEWLESVPGTAVQKDALFNCVSCHTVERIVKSTHDADEFVQTMKRMGSYANQSVPTRPQKRKAERLLEERGDQRDALFRKRAEWLASINLSEGTTWEYPLKTLPRPHGRATHVIITEYDLPRPSIEPHDVIVGKDGNAWYTNFGEQNIGKLDPKTGKVTEIALPELKKGWPQGSLGLRPDKDGNMWIGMMYQGAIGRVDPTTDKLTIYSLPPEMNKDMAQVNMVRAESAGVDGKVWSQNNGFAAIHRLDLASGNIETIAPFKDSKAGENHNIYDIIPDSQNNVYFTDFAQEHVGRVDAKTEKVTMYELPTKKSAPRRGMMDAQDRLWFGEYRGNKIAMFDTKAEKFSEWEMPLKWAAPYDVTVDKNGEVWTGSMMNDRVTRLDPKSGTFVDYLLPRETNIRRVFVDNSTTPVTFWVGNNHGGSIVKLEPLD
ncbi:MAG TPA: carboxypeptidase regulatory-like domain-containing protein [Xanthobacteraceae bacterium]|nr:carboxypeptidase regulatory-like domain-containing protein [Xanthobacteraceae bacterium]